MLDRETLTILLSLLIYDLCITILKTIKEKYKTKEDF